jgi:hypothetical protein
MRLWSAKRSSDSPSTEAAGGPDGPWAGLQYDPAARRGHVESWFLKANDPSSRRAVWLKWTLWAGDRDPARAVAEAWAVAFGAAGANVATKSTVPFEQARFARGAVGAEVDGCALSSRAARGCVESGGRAIAFDLTLEALEPPTRLYPSRWMYTGPVPSQKSVTPVPNARVAGTVTIRAGASAGGASRDERWDLSGWPGMIGHNWGRHTESYVWGHCNAWDDGADVVFEGASGRVRAAGMLLPLRTGIVVRHRGTTYALTDLRAIARNEAALTERRWRFRGEGPRVAIEGEMWADTEDFVGLYYTNPDGVMIHCLNSKIAHAEMTLTLAGRAPRRLRTTRAALEIGTRDPNHGVRMFV